MVKQRMALVLISVTSDIEPVVAPREPMTTGHSIGHHYLSHVSDTD